VVQVLPEVPPGGFGVGGVAPLHLGKAGEGVAEMGQVERPAGGVMGEPADAVAVRPLLDRREG